MIILYFDFYFLYILVSLFTKWWEQTSKELKTFLLWAYNLIINLFKLIILKIKLLIKFLFEKKLISISIIIIIILGNFMKYY